MAIEILWLGSLLRDLPVEVWRSCLAAACQRHPGAGSLVVNGNLAVRDGPLAERCLATLFENGVDVVTLGDQAVARVSSRRALERWPRLIRPLNLPPAAPGQGAFALKEYGSGEGVWIVSLMTGSERFPVDDPFDALEAFGRAHRPTAVLVDISGPDLEVRKALAWRAAEYPWPVHVLGSGLGVATDDLGLADGRLTLTDVGIVGEEHLIGGLPPAQWWTLRRHLPTPPPASPGAGYLRVDGVHLILEPNGRVAAATPLRLKVPGWGT
ncbi:MAG: Ser/Thr protein phosphatase family protein [Candidatus Ozemobacter sibiricus]|uniref:Ser/Thr protein phosphatase family protein n=1 Tax=Candidatus Ozemobacter sibiricus TaxID=2268124 RepID=A0A367ZKP8_9BACT|nr:MAG: Ser/Thr protein phosphatase family protein [Candidatus Ozemobacter sibiricus]